MKRIPLVHLQDGQTSAHNCKCGSEGKDELDFDSEKELTDDPATDSLPLWTSRTAPRDFVCGSPPFLSYSNQCRYLSSQKGSEATADDEQLMETMECESSYEELSFKEFIREEQNIEEPGQEEVGKEDGRTRKSEVKQEQNNRNSKQKKISRDFSTDSERLLLKVFLPVFLGSKMSKLISSTTTSSRMASSDIGLTSTDSTHQKKKNTNSKSSSKISKTRWYFCSGTCKPPRQRGCLFL